MELKLTDDAKEDIKFFVKSGQIHIVKKIEKLLVSIKETPFSGIGKPEPLKYEYSANGPGVLMVAIGLFMALRVM